MELPAADGELENGSRAGGWQLCGAETRTSYSAFCTAVNGNCRFTAARGANVANGAGGEIGEYLATSKRIAKVRLSLPPNGRANNYAIRHAKHYSGDAGAGGKSPNIFFADVMDEEDAFFDKALEGFALFAFNQGEVCTCPSRALVQESIYERFMERAIRRVESIRSGNPL